MKQLQTQTVSITPRLAEKWLNDHDVNKDNRPVSQQTVNYYASEMLAGRWRLNGDPIRFSLSGKLIDGQHRLWAVWQSGCTIEAVVIHGLAEDVFSTIDVGKRRTAMDILKMAKIPATSTLAAAARILYYYENDALTTRRPIPHSIIIEMLAKHPELADMANHDHHRKGLIPPAIQTVVTYMTRKHSVAMSEVFIEKLFTGHGTTATDPVGALHNALVNNAMAKRKQVGHIVLAWCIKAWNYQLAGLPMKQMSYTHLEKYPKFGASPSKAAIRTRIDRGEIAAPVKTKKRG